MRKIYDKQISDISVKFNSHELNTEPHKVLGVDVRGMPSILLSKYQLARADGEVITNANYGERQIVVEGRTKVIYDSTIGDPSIGNIACDNLDFFIDQLKSWLLGLNRELDVVINHETRRFIATLSNTKFEYKEDDVCLWNITFNASAISTGVDEINLTLGKYTDNDTLYTNTVLGNYRTSPILTFELNKVTPYWQANYIEIANPILNERMRITREWNWFDKLVVDGEAKTVSIYETAKLVFDTCDDFEVWDYEHYPIDEEIANHLQGSACLRIDMPGAANKVECPSFDRPTTSYFESGNGYLIIPVYLPETQSGAINSVSFYCGKNATLAADYEYWTVTKDYDGTDLKEDDWSFIVIDLSSAPTGSNGTPDRSKVKSVKIQINGTANMNFFGGLIDYITIQKPNPTAVNSDYLGKFVNIEPNAGNLKITDDFDTRDIDITGKYKKKYL